MQEIHFQTFLVGRSISPKRQILSTLQPTASPSLSTCACQESTKLKVLFIPLARNQFHPSLFQGVRDTAEAPAVGSWDSTGPANPEGGKKALTMFREGLKAGSTQLPQDLYLWTPAHKGQLPGSLALTGGMCCLPLQGSSTSISIYTWELPLSRASSKSSSTQGCPERIEQS